MNAYVINDKLCRRSVLLEQYESKPVEILKNHLCCDICAIMCECKEDLCTSLLYPYVFSKGIEEEMCEFEDLGLDSSTCNSSEESNST